VEKKNILPPGAIESPNPPYFQPAAQSLCCVQRLEGFMGRDKLGELGVDGSKVLKLIRDRL